MGFRIRVGTACGIGLFRLKSCHSDTGIVDPRTVHIFDMLIVSQIFPFAYKYSKSSISAGISLFTLGSIHAILKKGGEFR